MVLFLIQKRIVLNNQNKPLINVLCNFIINNNKLSTFQTPKVDRLCVTYNEKKILGYPKEYMYELVKDVKHYKEFVPWCLKSDILPENISSFKTKSVSDQFNLQLPESFNARLEVGYPPIKESYISHVTCIKPRLVKTVAIKTTFFDYINAEWKFYSFDHLNNKIIFKEDLNKKYDYCVVEFHVAFKFRTSLYSQFSSLFLDNIFKKNVSAFIKRANDIYGKQKIVPKDYLSISSSFF